MVTRLLESNKAHCLLAVNTVSRARLTIKYLQLFDAEVVQHLRPRSIVAARQAELFASSKFFCTHPCKPHS